MWERGDRGIEEVSTEIRDQGARNDALEQARLCSRSAARSTGRGGRSTARSTGVHDVHKVSPVDRPVDRERERSTDAVDRGMGRSTGRSRFDIPFGIQIPFLNGIEFNLGFLKSRDSVAINKG